MSFDKYFSHWDADLYDQTETQTEDVELLQRLIGDRKNMNAFEVACGSGRILLPLAHDGHRMTGIDRGNMMIAKLFEKAKGLTGITVIQDDAVVADWGKGYDLVIVAGNILLNIVSDADPLETQRQFIQKAFEALGPGGYLFMDNNGFMHPEPAFNQPGTRMIFDGTDSNGVYGRYMLMDSNYNAATHTCSGKRRWELTAPGEETCSKEELYSKFIPSIAHMKSWVTQAGFSVELSYGDYSGNPIGENTSRAIYWARKPK